MAHQYDNAAALDAVPTLKGNRGLCTINAYAELVGEDMGTAAYMLCETAAELGAATPGFRFGRGDFHCCLFELGLKLYAMERVDWPGATVRTFARNADPDKLYLVYTQRGGHVMPIVRGEVRDWAEGRLFTIYQAYEVTLS